MNPPTSACCRDLVRIEHDRDIEVGKEDDAKAIEERVERSHIQPLENRADDAVIVERLASIMGRRE